MPPMSSLVSPQSSSAPLKAWAISWIAERPSATGPSLWPTPTMHTSRAIWSTLTSPSHAPPSETSCHREGPAQCGEGGVEVAGPADHDRVDPRPPHHDERVTLLRFMGDFGLQRGQAALHGGIGHLDAKA